MAVDKSAWIKACESNIIQCFPGFHWGGHILTFFCQSCLIFAGTVLKCNSLRPFPNFTGEDSRQLGWDESLINPFFLRIILIWVSLTFSKLLHHFRVIFHWPLPQIVCLKCFSQYTVLFNEFSFSRDNFFTIFIKILKQIWTL